MPWFDVAGPEFQFLLLLVPAVPTVATVLLQLLVLPLAVWFEVRAAGRRRRGVRTLWDEWPSVSIIVAAHNAASTIDSCIRSIRLTRHARYELILVDDGSTDNTGEMMASAAAADPRIKVLRQPREGRAAARNLGVRNAAGDVVMFVDADAAVSRWTVDHMLQGFEGPRIGAVSGEGRPERWRHGGLLAAISHLGTAMTRRALTGLGGRPFPPFGIEAATSKVLAELGPFREAGAGAELELLWRVHEAGYRVGLAPSVRVRVRTAPAPTLPDLWHLRARRARGLLYAVMADHRLIGSSWRGWVLRHERLVPFVPVYSVFTALSMLAGLARYVRGLAERRRKPSGPGAGAVAGAGADRHDEARRTLREAWA